MALSPLTSTKHSGASFLSTHIYIPPFSQCRVFQAESVTSQPRLFCHGRPSSYLPPEGDCGPNLLTQLAPPRPCQHPHTPTHLLLRSQCYTLTPHRLLPWPSHFLPKHIALLQAPHARLRPLLHRLLIHADARHPWRRVGVRE